MRFTAGSELGSLARFRYITQKVPDRPIGSEYAASANAYALAELLSRQASILPEQQAIRDQRLKPQEMYDSSKIPRRNI